MGCLGHISETWPWLRSLLAHLYTSVTYALGLSKAHLISTWKEFRELLKELKKTVIKNKTSMLGPSPTMWDSEDRKRPFMLSVTAKAIHKLQLSINMNKHCDRSCVSLSRPSVPIEST